MKSLRDEFNYYKRRLKERLIDEQAFREARGGMVESTMPETLYNMQNLTYDKILSKGITRIVGGKRVTFTGVEALKVEIRSMKSRASKSYQKNMFIDNYVQAMLNTGFNNKDIRVIENLLRRTSADKLSLLINKGMLKSIQYLYAEDGGEIEQTIDEIKNILKKGISTEEVKELKRKAEKLKPLIRERQKILNKK